MTEKISRHINLSVLFGLIVGILILFIQLYTEGHIETGTDMYYYISLADSLIDFGSLSDITTFDVRAVATPQNGLPIIIYLLKKANIDNYSILTMIMILNYILWALAVIPFIKLIKLAKLKSPIAESILVIGFLASFNILFYQLMPITDGIYNAGSIWLVYLLYNKIFVQGLRSTLKKEIYNWIPLILLSSVLVHFSFRIFIFLAAFLITVLAIKKRDRLRHSALILLTILSTSLSLWLSFLFIDTSRMYERGGAFFLGIFQNLINIKPVIFAYLFFVPSLAKPESIAALLDAIASVFIILVAIFFVLYVLYCLQHAWRKKDVMTFYLSVLIGMFFILTSFLPSLKVYHEAAVRYMMASLPLFYLLAAKFKWSRYFIFGVIFFAVVFSVFKINNYTMLSPGAEMNSYLRRKELSLPQDAILLSKYDRNSYVWLNGRSSDKVFCSLDLKGKNRLWIAGDFDYHKLRLERFQECHNKKIISTVGLTTDFKDKNRFNVIEYNF